MANWPLTSVDGGERIWKNQICLFICKLGGRLYNEFCYRLNKKQIVGGDDVVNWILGVICDLRLPESPSIVPISHGIENNIPLSFGWVKCLIHVVKAGAFKSRSNTQAFLLVKH
ncbi:uncharacterized protein [Malus domestica]|uniref:uncharacterized protein isoform X2 n=1 Tax=Malus domestica TaxID=3750 RepID=UPI0039754663